MVYLPYPIFMSGADMVMSDNSLVNLDNLAVTVLQAGIRKAQSSTLDESQRLAYVKAVKIIALQIKSNQELSEEQQRSVLNLIYHDQDHKSTMGQMRKILSEVGSQLEFKAPEKHHEYL